MERQITIKHQSSDFWTKEIIACLMTVVDSKDKIVCNFIIDSKESSVANSIRELEQCNLVDFVEITSSGKQDGIFTYNITTNLFNLEHFLSIVEEYELNVLIIIAEVKLIINDNDGDYFIIDSRHKNFRKLKFFCKHIAY